MLITVYRKGRKRFTTDRYQEAARAVLEDPKTARVVLGKAPVAVPVDLKRVLPRRPEDGNHYEESVAERLKIQILLASLTALSEYRKPRIFRHWVKQMRPSEILLCAIIEYAAKDYAVSYLAPVLDLNSDLSLLDGSSLDYWGRDFQQYCWNEINRMAEKSRALDCLITRAVLDPMSAIDMAKEVDALVGADEVPTP